MITFSWGWLNTWVVGTVTSGSLFLLWLSRIVERIEGRWSRRYFRAKPRKIVLPFEHQIDEWLKYSHVKMTAKQWYGLILFFPVFFTILGSLSSRFSVAGLAMGLYMSVSLILYPRQKRKKFNLDMVMQIQRTKRMMAKLYARHVKTDEMLPLVADVLEDGEYKSYVNQAIARTKTMDTLAEAIEWMSDELQLTSLRALAIVMVQGFHYANLPLDVRLAKMAEKDRERALINFDKLAEGKRMRALVEAGAFIVLPLIGLLSVFVFYYVYQKFTMVQI